MCCAPARWPKRERRADAAPDIALKDVTLMRPVVFPEKILCIGVNYGNRHAEYKDNAEAGEISEHVLPHARLVRRLGRAAGEACGDAAVRL